MPEGVERRVVERDFDWNLPWCERLGVRVGERNLHKTDFLTKGLYHITDQRTKGVFDEKC